MSTDAALISYIVRNDKLLDIQRYGITTEHFVDQYRTIFNYLLRTRREHDAVPSPATLKTRFPDIDLPKVRESELPVLLNDIRKRHKYISILELLNAAATGDYNQDNVDEMIQTLQSGINALSYAGNQRSHMVDLFSPEASKVIKKELKRRKSAEFFGTPTGLEKFDNICGGLHRQRMITIIARSGIGKSWLDLMFAVNAVMHGAKVVLYPLEMTLFETATRLYSLMTCGLFGPQKALKNLDLTQGKVSMSKVARMTSILEDRFKGQLYVADVASLADPYTNERIEAEVEYLKPDMFWVDYITLLKNTGREEGHELIRKLSDGIKNTAMRQNVIGGASAQVNREAIKSGERIPRLEHIAYGDAIGQNSDQVFSLNGRGKWLWYALVKNRHGPEIGPTKMAFQPNVGYIKEHREQDDEEA